MRISKPSAVAISRLFASHHPSYVTTMSSIDADNGILMILSPAKTLDLSPLSERLLVSSDVNADAIEKMSCEYSLPLCDESKTRMIVQAMKNKSEAELKSLLKLSPTLAKSSHEYWSKFDVAKCNLNSSNNFAVFTFSGPAFQGISPQNCNMSTLSYLAKNLFILDPVYGTLRALDRMQPYRLEMGCKGVVNNEGSTKKKETLATYWKDSITTHIGNQLSDISSTNDGGHHIIANLASEEYSSSLDISSLPPNTIFVNILFRHKGRVIAVHAKRARGLMARYIAETKARSLSDISEFDLEVYQYICTHGSTKEEKWETVNVVGDNVQVVNMVFDRDDTPSSAGQNLKRKDDGADTKKSSKQKRK